MMKKFVLPFILCWVILSHINAQSILSSNTYIQTKYHHEICFSVNNSSYLFYDESRQTLFLKIDFSKFKSGQDSLDEWLEDLSSTYFYFKAELSKTFLEGGFANHQGKSVKLTGNSYLNGVWHSQNIELNFFGVESSTGTKGAYDNVRTNFGFSIMPKDFKIHKKPHHLKKVINIGVTLGRINQLTPEMEKIFEEVLNSSHH